MSFTDGRQLEKCRQVLKVEYMSSEESATDGEDEVMLVKTLPWRSEYVEELFWRLDYKALVEKSPQARRQMMHRVIGDPSSRPRPIGDLPSWAVTDQP